MKKGNNKKLKQALADIALQDRKIIWMGDGSEVFLARSNQALYNYYCCDVDEEFEEMEFGELHARYLWKYAACEEPIGGARKVKGSKHYYAVPAISFTQGHSVIQLFSSEN